MLKINHESRLQALAGRMLLLLLTGPAAAAPTAPAETTEWSGGNLKQITSEEGSAVFEAATRQSFRSIVPFPVDSTQTCRITGEFRTLPGGSGNTRLYFGFQELDAKGEIIETRQVNVIGGTDTRLAEDVKAGAADFRIMNPGGWKISGKHCYAVFHARPDFSDLPNRGEIVNVVKVENDRVFLARPLTSDYPDGTGVRLHRDRAPHNNIGADGTVLTNEWQHFTGIVRGVQHYGTRDDKWRPGTAQAKIALDFAAPSGSTDRIQFRNISVGHSGDRLVTDGVPDLRMTVFDRQGWQTRDGALQGGGTGQTLASYHAYEPDAFEAEAELELQTLDATAAAIYAGNIIWGFDGGKEHSFFVEGRDFRTRFLSPAGERISPGRIFKVRLVGSQGQMTLYINGETIGNCNYSTSRPMFFGLRPHRNQMKVRNFSVRGIRNSEAVPVAPVVTQFVDIAHYKNFSLPGYHGPAGKYSVAFIPGNKPASAPVEIEIAVDDDNRVEAAVDDLRRIYEAAGGDFNLRPFLMKFSPPGYAEYRARLMLGNSAAPIDFPQGEIRRINGRSRMFLNGKPRGILQALWSYNGRASGEKSFAWEPVARFGKAGIDGNILILAPYKYLGADRYDLDGMMSEIEGVVSRILAENPHAIFDIQFFLFTSEEWNDLHREELIRLDNGVERLAHAYKQMLMPSYASPAWRRCMAEVIRRTVSAMRRSPYADRLASFRVLYANCGEWNHWGYHEKAFVDFSLPMQRAFGNWLKEKYRTVEALRTAWKCADLDFHSASLVPSREQRLTGGPLFRVGPGVRQSTDYYAFFSEYTADTILHFTGAVKEASDRRLLTGSYYGYYFGHYYANPYHFQDSGNYAAGKMLRSKDIDFFGAPNPYYNRINTFWLNGIAGSFPLHGKLYVREGDMRTEYSGPPHQHYGVPAGNAEALEIAKRDFAGSRERGIAYYFYDFIADWYRAPEMMNLIGVLNRLDHALAEDATEYCAAEIALIFSEAVIPHLSSAGGDRVLRDFSGDELNRLGMPVDLYLESDLDRIDFSRYKAVIFANSFYTDDLTVAKIKRYAARNDRMLVFLSAPGLIGENDEFDPERSFQLTGVRIEPLSRPATGTPITTIWGKTSCTTPYARPAKITDGSAKVLAAFADGTPAAAERRFTDYRSVVVMHPFPDAIFLRDLLTTTKVQVWTSGKQGLDNCYFALPLIGYTAGKGGEKQLNLPKPVEIAADLLSGEILAKNSAKVFFSMPDALHTRLIFVGPETEYRKIVQAAELPELNTTVPRKSGKWQNPGGIQ